MVNSLSNYFDIRSQIDLKCDKLHSDHILNTQCKKGCSACCMNFSILPIEFHAILSKIKKEGNVKTNSSEKGCLFLVEHRCTIYENRPSICRSHGLPILNMDEEGENWELSYCPLNFTNVDEDYFNLENGYQQDVFNSKLYLLNQNFIEKYKAINYKNGELIEIREMEKYL